MSTKTSWDHIGDWYAELTKEKGHYFHKAIVIPKVLSLLHLKKTDRVLDIACGTGTFGRSIPKDIYYVGFDLSNTLIQEAKKKDTSHHHTYLVADATKPYIFLQGKTVARAVCILALQNIESYKNVFLHAATALDSGGVFVIVLNHPMFRIPRQTSWGFDEQNKLQYRRVNRYLSPLNIPIAIHPSKQHRSPIVWSFHQPLSAYVTGLRETGFVITHIEEWTSDKKSEGKYAKAEDFARSEIPLFMTIVAKKVKNVCG